MTTALDVNAYLTSAPRKYLEAQGRLAVINGLADIIVNATLEELENSSKFIWGNIAMNIITMIMASTPNELQKLDASKITAVLDIVFTRYGVSSISRDTIQRRLATTKIIFP